MKTLTISTAYLDPNIVAREVATFGVTASITPGVCEVAGKVETQATIRFYGATFDEVWQVWTFLAYSWGLTCAWFDDAEGFAGCILDYRKRATFPEYRGGVSSWLDGERFPEATP